MVSYDNAQSFGAWCLSLLFRTNGSFYVADKGKFILEKGLAGFSMWDASGDYQNILLDSITGSIGR
jgi:chitinase